MASLYTPLTAVVALFAVALPGGSQESNTTLSLSQALQIALKNNPEISAQTAFVRSSIYGEKSAKSLANPEIVFTPAVSGPGGSDEEILIRQPLEINGQRSIRSSAAKAAAQIVEADADIEIQNVLLRTRLAYWELARVREQVSLAKDVAAFAEELHLRTERMVEAGSRPGIDRTQSSIEASRARQQLALIEQQHRIAVSELNTLLGRSPEDAIPPLDSIQAEPDNLTEKDAVATALRQRPEILASRARKLHAFQELKLAEVEGRPELAAQFRADSITRGGLENSGFGVALTLPLVDWGSRRERIRQAEESKKAYQSKMTVVENEVMQDVHRTFIQAQAAQAVLAEYRAGILDESKKLLEASRTGLQLGQTNILTLLESQRTYRSVQSGYIDALVDAAKANAYMDHAIGELPEGFQELITRERKL